MGGTLGAAFAGVCGLDGTFTDNFILFAMAGVFAGIVRAPLTGIVLITEMSGTFTGLLPCAIVAVTAYLTANALEVPPIYDSLLAMMGDGRGRRTDKIVSIEIPVQYGCFAEDKKVKELGLPDHAITLATVIRDGRELTPRGETRLRGGDCLILLYDTGREQETREKLAELFKSG